MLSQQHLHGIESSPVEDRFVLSLVKLVLTPDLPTYRLFFSMWLIAPRPRRHHPEVMTALKAVAMFCKLALEKMNRMNFGLA